MASFAQLNAQVAALTEGKYAVIGKDGETPYFFEIANVKGAHRIFRLIGSPGDYKRHTLNVAWQTHALNLLTALPTASMVLYGQLAKFCGACDSALTHARSLACGMGPKCAPKWGVKW
jgi:hypothetical protein